MNCTEPQQQTRTRLRSMARARQRVRVAELDLLHEAERVRDASVRTEEGYVVPVEIMATFRQAHDAHARAWRKLAEVDRDSTGVERVLVEAIVAQEALLSEVNLAHAVREGRSQRRKKRASR